PIMNPPGQPTRRTPLHVYPYLALHRNPYADTGWRNTTRLPRDHYVQLDSNDYSVHPAVIGRRVEVIADLEQVSVTCQGQPVARHERCWADHQTITDPAHAAAAVKLRQAHRIIAASPSDLHVERRSLTDYDRMFGLIDSDQEGVA
ncbi:hypothetical protein AB0B89_19825, partial [Sphaerisporangium sp. NPDC049002]